MRLNFNRALFTCDLNLRSDDIVTPRCLWESLVGMVMPSNTKEGGCDFLLVKVCCVVFVALKVIIQFSP